MTAKSILDHQFVIAAFAVTWVIQLGYLVWLGFKWHAQKQAALRSTGRLRSNLSA
jgi:hypothetical protein